MPKDARLHVVTDVRRNKTPEGLRYGTGHHGSGVNVQRALSAFLASTAVA